MLQAEEVIDKVVKEAISKPWLPLPLGLKPPSTESVLTELSKQGISTIPPNTRSTIRRWRGGTTSLAREWGSGPHASVNEPIMLMTVPVGTSIDKNNKNSKKMKKRIHLCYLCISLIRCLTKKVLYWCFGFHPLELRMGHLGRFGREQNVVVDRIDPTEPCFEMGPTYWDHGLVMGPLWALLIPLCNNENLCWRG